MSKEVDISQIQEGTNVAFRPGGFIGPALSFVLFLMDKDWRKVKPKFWHVGFIVSRKTVMLAIRRQPEIADFANFKKYDDMWWVCESLAKGVTLTPLSKYEGKGLRFFNVLENQPTPSKVADYLTLFVGRPYDVLIYFWNILAELLVKVGIELGCWYNSAYMCWENLESFMDFIGEGMCKNSKHIMLTDFAKAWGLVPEKKTCMFCID